MPTNRITTKNLHFTKPLPPFLARLQQGAYASGPTTSQHHSDPDRHSFSVARPKRARTGEEEAEDEPTFVDEVTGREVTREEYERLVRGDEGVEEEGGKKDEADGGDDEGEGEEEMKEKEERRREKVAVIGGGGRRRRGVRVVGVEGDVESEEERGKDKDEVRPRTGKYADDKEDVKGKAGEKKGTGPTIGPVKQAKKGKAKKIKLSFGDDE